MYSDLFQVSVSQITENKGDDGLSVSLPAFKNLYFLNKPLPPHFCIVVLGWIIMTGSEGEVEVTGATMMMMVREKINLAVKDKVGNCLACVCGN